MNEKTKKLGQKLGQLFFLVSLCVCVCAAHIHTSARILNVGFNFALEYRRLNSAFKIEQTS